MADNIFDKRQFSDLIFPFDAFTFSSPGTASPQLILDSTWTFNVNSDFTIEADDKSIIFGEGSDAKTYYNGTDLIIDSDVAGSGSCKINGLEIDKDGYIKPISSADSAAPNNSIYYSTDSSKLVYKDSGGSVNDLY